MMRRGQAYRVALVAMILCFVISLGALPASAQTAAPSQSAPTIETAELKLWPEYDDPGLLVIFSGEFTEGTAFPLQAAFPVPAGARNIQATYQNTSAGSLINRPFEVKDGKLTYELPSRAFHLEYYVDRAPSSEQRDIAYEFVAPYAVDALRVAVQQPARASGFTLTPAAENSETGPDGLTYHVLNHRNLAAGEKVGIDIKYSKPDTGLSAPQLAVAPTSAAVQPAAGVSGTQAAVGTSSISLLPWLLIGLGLLLLTGVLVYWLLSQRRAGVRVTATASAAGQARPVSAPQVRPAPRTRSSGEAVSFCTNCGHPLKTEDRFCSQCGAPRRS